MNCWPLPNIKIALPKSKHKRGFARNHKNNKFHAGVDLLAPFGTYLHSIEEGIVENIFLFTYPKLDKYGKTYALAIKYKDGNYATLL